MVVVGGGRLRRRGVFVAFLGRLMVSFCPLHRRGGAGTSTIFARSQHRGVLRWDSCRLSGMLGYLDFHALLEVCLLHDGAVVREYFMYLFVYLCRYTRQHRVQ